MQNVRVTISSVSFNLNAPRLQIDLNLAFCNAVDLMRSTYELESHHGIRVSKMNRRNIQKKSTRFDVYR